MSTLLLGSFGSSCVLGRALERAERSLAGIIRKAATWDRINSGAVINERQRLVLNMILDGPESDLSTSRYAKLAHCSLDTALRDLKSLVESGVIRPGRRVVAALAIECAELRLGVAPSWSGGKSDAPPFARHVGP
jgi:hypothetical protein